ncbi:claudin-2-like [Festucalex cinctus]
MAMVSLGLELVAFFLGLIGLLGSLVTTALPFWEVSVGASTGLWMECMHGLNGSTVCSMYKSVPTLSYDLQMSRILMVVSLALSTLGLLVTVVGMQCTIWLESSEALKSRVAGTGGCFVFAAGVMSLVPVSWAVHQLIGNFSSVPGTCLYLGIASAVVSMLAGCMLAVSFHDGERRGSYTYKCDGGGIPMAVAENSSSLQMGGIGMSSGGQAGFRSCPAGSFLEVHVKPIGSSYDIARCL